MKYDLSYEEKPVRVLDTQERVTHRRVVKLYKVVWSNHSDRDATWEREDYLKENYPAVYIKWYASKSWDEIFLRVEGCNTLGVWLPLIAFHFISMCIIYVIISIVTETYICNIRTFCLFRIGVLMNDSIATYECNINFSYLETWQHGRNMTSVE